MNKIIVCDIDKTIADPSHRLHYIQGDNKDWKSFYDEVDKDEPIETVVDFLNNVRKRSFLNDGYELVFITGRSEICLDKTLDWLNDNIYGVVFRANLMMRGENDRRPDTEVKPELLNKYMNREAQEESKVAFILDDRNSMVKKWRELGYTCFQVADGDF